MIFARVILTQNNTYVQKSGEFFFNIIKTKSDLKKQKIYLKEYVTVPNYGRLKTTLLMLYLPEIVDRGTKTVGYVHTAHTLNNRKHAMVHGMLIYKIP